MLRPELLAPTERQQLLSLHATSDFNSQTHLQSVYHSLPRLEIFSLKTPFECFKCTLLEIVKLIPLNQKHTLEASAW